MTINPVSPKRNSAIYSKSLETVGTVQYLTLLRGMLALGKVKVRASMIRPLTPLPLEKKMNRPGGVLAERELRLRKATGL